MQRMVKGVLCTRSTCEVVIEKVLFQSSCVVCEGSRKMKGKRLELIFCQNTKLQFFVERQWSGAQGG